MGGGDPQRTIAVKGGGKDRRAFGELEGRILGAMWAMRRPASASEILDAIDEDVAYTTVAKVLDRLFLKGEVTRVRRGRSYAFEPVANESAVVAEQVRGLMGRAGSRSAVLQGLVDGISEADAAALMDLLQRAREGKRADT